MNQTKIFISYSEKDKSRMRSLEKVILKSVYYTPVIVADRRETFASLSEKVQKGIFESEIFVPLLTKNSISTQWINQEIGYAVALNRTIIPIVEKDIMELLKGFVHKNIDLPYVFSESIEEKTARAQFRKICSLLVNDLMIKNNFIVNSIELENVFPGTWMSRYKGPYVTGEEFEIEIKENNKYYTKGKYWFDIEQFKVHIGKRKLKFIKFGIGDDKRRYVNDLYILKLGEVYSGVEYQEGDDIKTEITYSRVK